jgi:2-polyprenyl-3-methyl-5-hydroxy-6-metoxy-1,4-benzoquinol methylase
MQIDLKHRSNAEEIMDDLELDTPVLFRTLRELDFINETLGGNQISLKSFKKKIIGLRRVSVLDMGTGSGMMLRKMYGVARKQQKQFMATGIDANAHVCTYASSHTPAELPITYSDKDVFDEACYEHEVEIIHACLFTHHFSEEQLVWLFRRWKKTAKTAVIVNDLHRNPIAYYSIKWLTRLFSSSSMVKYDAPLSVARGFKKKELEQILSKAGIEEYQLQWKWAFRWLLVF